MTVSAYLADAVDEQPGRHHGHKIVGQLAQDVVVVGLRPAVQMHPVEALLVLVTGLRQRGGLS